MHVSIVSETWPPEINGVALTVAGLARGLADSGHAVHVIRPRQSSDAADLDVASGMTTTLMRGMRLPRYEGLQFGLPATRRLCALWTKQRPDVIHVATEGPLGWSALRAARSLRIPASTSFHTRFDDFVRHYGLGFLSNTVFNWLRRFHLTGAATFVPTAELTAFLASRGVSNVIHMPRAVDTALFDPRRRDEILRANWGIGPHQLAVIHVGRVAPEKNLDLGVRSFRAIQERLPDARYIWVGDGPARERLARENPDFIFAGIRRDEELARHYASADLFLFPSLTETFGNVTLEALASGVPTVAFDYGAAREQLTADCGCAVPFGDADAFVRAACTTAAEVGDGNIDLRRNARAAVEHLDPRAVTAQFAQGLAHLAFPSRPREGKTAETSAALMRNAS